MSAGNLDGRVVAIAGVAGGLGPVVAERLAAAGATIAGADVSQARVEEVGSVLGLPAERWDGRAVDLLDEEATRAGARPCSSASVGSTRCCTWSAAGAGGSRCTRSRSTTGACCTTC